MRSDSKILSTAAGWSGLELPGKEDGWIGFYFAARSLLHFPALQRETPKRCLSWSKRQDKISTEGYFPIHDRDYIYFRFYLSQNRFIYLFFFFSNVANVYYIGNTIIFPFLSILVFHRFYQLPFILIRKILE